MPLSICVCVRVCVFVCKYIYIYIYIYIYKIYISPVIDNSCQFQHKLRLRQQMKISQVILSAFVLLLWGKSEGKTVLPVCMFAHVNVSMSLCFHD